MAEQKNEVWKDVPGFEGRYQISNLGNVMSLDYRHTGKPHLMAQCTVMGYKMIRFKAKGRNEMYKVHRLVAMAFIPNPNNYKQVNHKDENKTNNVVDNLEWCTAKYNSNYGTRLQRLSASLMNYKAFSKPVYLLHEDGSRTWFPSIKEATRQTGITPGTISCCCTGRQRTTQAGKFVFAEGE